MPNTDPYSTENPALYDAMFTRATRLRFGAGDVAAPLSTVYAQSRGTVATIAGERDIDALTKVRWAAPHGLIMLGRNDRLRPAHDTARIGILIAQFQAAHPRRRSTVAGTASTSPPA